MINKFLYWFVTVPARSLAMIGAALVVVLLLGVFGVARAAGPSAKTGQGTISIGEPTPLGPSAAAQETAQAVATVTPGTSPGFGGTVDLNGWTISLARMEQRSCVSYKGTDGTVNVTNQPHYLIWVDAKNDTDASRALRGTISWSVRTEGDHVYYALPDQDLDTEETAQWIPLEGRDFLSHAVDPGQQTHPLLAFRTFGFKPLNLMVSSVEDVPKVVTFDLSAGDNPTPAGTPPPCQ